MFKKLKAGNFELRAVNDEIDVGKEREDARDLGDLEY
jgi:hypothetical protein